MREPNLDLKFLNIDYTQFDDWSSDEEITIYTGNAGIVICCNGTFATIVPYYLL